MTYSGPTRLYIGEEWTDAADGETIETPDPATEETYATVSRAGEEDVDRAVDAAQNAMAPGSEW